jgi:hypothetical protein
MKKNVIKLSLGLMTCALLWISMVGGVVGIAAAFLATLAFLPASLLPDGARSLLVAIKPSETNLIMIVFTCSAMFYFSIKACRRCAAKCNRYFSVDLAAQAGCLLESSAALKTRPSIGAPVQIASGGKDYQIGSYGWR